MENTLIIIKSDGVKRGLIGSIIKRIEDKGFEIAQAKLCSPNRELLEMHYEEHKGKPYFENLIEYMLEGPIMVMNVKGKDVISILRLMIGDKDPLKALPGTIRGDYAFSVTKNIIHGLDSRENAEREISIWFKNMDGAY